MAKASPSATEAPPLPAPEPTPPETPVEGEQVEATPVEGVAAPVQEAEKPDVLALLRELPAEERTRVRDEIFGEDLQQKEKDAESAAYSRLEAAHLRQQKANADLNSTWRNAQAETDENRALQHIASFAQGYAEDYAKQQAQSWRGYFDDAYMQAFGLKRGEYEAAWIDVHKEARKQGRSATDGDFLAHMMGEKFMPKAQMSKELSDEVKARVEEEVGNRLAGQPAPVTLGPAEAGTGSLTSEKYKAMSEEDRRRLSPDEIDAMTRRYLT